METPQGQPRLTIREMCGLVGVSRASYHRHQEESAPNAQETALRDALQRQCGSSLFDVGSVTGTDVDRWFGVGMACLGRS